MKYRFRVEHKTEGRKTITVQCTNPANVIKTLARFGWVVQVYYEV